MDYKKYKTFEKENHTHVFGKTIMNHGIRVKLGLTCIEYVLLDFIKGWQDKNDKRIRYSDLWIFTGIAPEHIPDLWKNLIAKEMVYYDDETGLVTTDSKFDECFNKDNDFQDFWEHYGRVLDNDKNYTLIGNIGNRQMAMKNYRKAIKVITPAELKQKAREYTDYCVASTRYIQHASTWLNPVNRKWEDILTMPKEINIKEKPLDPAMEGMVM